MNHTGKKQPTNQTTNPKRMFAFWHRPFVSLGIIASIATGIALLANAQQPVLKISNLGSNQFSVLITNGISTTNYTLFWTPALQDQNYPWQVLGIGNTGETNFTVDGGQWDSGWFRVLLGADQDGDGIPEWQDAQPQNPAVGILSVTIDSPTSGFNFN